jgi:regulator of protease activity HflC (stomatin/prohibitin superfamily)
MVGMQVKPLKCTSECKTKDNVTLTVETVVQYCIKKDMVREAVFEIENPELQMRAFVDNILRSKIPEMDLDETYSAKEKMVGDIVTELKAAMTGYGFEIINVLMTDLRPEKSVLDAMNDINASRRRREAAMEKGEADKILLIKAAEADAEAKFQSGKGIARMRKAITEGFSESIKEMTSVGLEVAPAMHMMMVTQYLDTLKEFSNGKASIMVPHGPGAIADIESQVRNGFISASAMTGGASKHI